MPRIRCAAFLIAAILHAQPKPASWESLFDGKSLGNWHETNFSGHAAPHVENGTILLPPGAPMTGVTWTAPFPQTNYEIRWEAARLDGNDFFASLTFPVGDSFCTWVLGGWGGDIVGLSSIDGWDASDNETRTYFDFEKGSWYGFRLQVAGGRIEGWIDKQPVFNVEIGGRKIDMRPGEIERSAPFGFASYGTTGGVRKIEYRIVR